MTTPSLAGSAPRTGGTLALLSWAGRCLLRAPRSIVVGATLAWSSWIWWHSSKEGNIGVEPDFWWGWFTNLGHAPAFAFVALGLLIIGLQSSGSHTDRPPGGRLPVVSRKTAGGVMAITVVYGLVDEIHQSFVLGRTASVFDLLTDTCGAASVVWVVAYLTRENASSAGLRWRLLLGSVACILSALLATLMD